MIKIILWSYLYIYNITIKTKHTVIESAKLRGCVGSWVAWVRGWRGLNICVGSVGPLNFGVGGVGRNFGQKHAVRQKNGMGLNALLFNYTL